MLESLKKEKNKDKTIAFTKDNITRIKNLYDHNNIAKFGFCSKEFCFVSFIFFGTKLHCDL